MPGKSRKILLLTLECLYSLVCSPLTPFKIIFKWSFLIFFIGVFKSISYKLAICLICFVVKLFFEISSACIPFWLIDFESSGIIFFKSTSNFCPIPLQDLHAPLGELNENVFGSGSWYAIADSGHIIFVL